MMRLGRIQQDVITVLRQAGSDGRFIGAGTKAVELRGYDLEQVERALDGLYRRGIIRREGIRTILVESTP